jgi:hypothetical protein
MLSDYPYVSVILLIALLYAGYEDFTRRKITTLPFLCIDAGLLLYFALTSSYLAIFLVPVLSEFFLKKYSMIIYVLVILPLLLSPSIITLSLAYSILLIKAFSVMIRNFGRGDLKVLQTIAVSVPLYPHLPILDSLFPPVLAVILIASLIGVISSAAVHLRGRDEKSVRKFASLPAEGVKDKNKFWISGDRAVYKIPFVTCIAVGFAIIFILSSLRLV